MTDTGGQAVGENVFHRPAVKIGKPKTERAFSREKMGEQNGKGNTLRNTRRECRAHRSHLKRKNKQPVKEYATGGGNDRRGACENRNVIVSSEKLKKLRKSGGDDKQRIPICLQFFQRGIRGLTGLI